MTTVLRKFAADRTALTLAAICLTAFALRLAYRVHMGEADFWQHGYGFYYEIAANIAAGKGIYWSQFGTWAARAPLYAILLSVPALLGGQYLLMVVPQAVLGAGTVLCAFLIGRLLFGARTGLIAAGLAAVYPFYVVHDTAMQETGLLTFCAALSVYLLLLARREGAAALWLLAGFALGLAVLTRAMMLPFALSALAWIALFGGGNVRERIRSTLLVFAALAVIVGMWVGRNEIVLGRPVLNTEAGQLFWIAHNDQTFSRYPQDSIDRSAERAVAALSLADQRTLQAMAHDELGRGDWYLKRGMDYVRAHPRQTVIDAGRKVAAGFSWRFNPSPGPMKQLVYFLSYAPIAVLGLAGMLVTGRNWREHSIIYLQFLCFILVSAIYFAHTDHRAYLDIYGMVFAAAVIDRAVIALCAASHKPPSLRRHTPSAGSFG